MKTITTALLATAAIVTSCSTETQTTRTPQTAPAATIQSPTIAYDPVSVTREEVVSAITEVFNARSYKTTLGRQTGVQMGAGGVAIPFEEGPVCYVTTEMLPPVEGSNSKQWKYRAIIDNRSVKLQVFVECIPYNLLGMTIDSELTSWEPPDTKRVVREIQKRLQTH